MAAQGQTAPSSPSSIANGPPGPTTGPPRTVARTVQEQVSTFTTTDVTIPIKVQNTLLAPQQQLCPQANNVEVLDKSSSNTLKRNPKMELSKGDLLKLLGYLEAELQARDVVIAALKSEKMKHLLSSRYLSSTVDPRAALARDVAIAGGGIGSEGNQIDQVAALEALVIQQRRTQCRMTKVLKDAEIRHRAVIKELEEEKRKHEHDTAQGDDITYGLEKERTRLKKELELEKQERKRLELDLKKAAEGLEEEKNRQKQIVLLLLAERKKIIVKYIEERKRSEDLAQILGEEKIRIDSMAEGLEEESKKSLQMEAELEKQLAQFDMERQQYRQALLKEEKRVQDLEGELEKLRAELEIWKEPQPTRSVPRGIGVPTAVAATTTATTTTTTTTTTMTMTMTMTTATATATATTTTTMATPPPPPPPPAKPPNLVAMPTLRGAGTVPQSRAGSLGTGTPMVSSKVVQPTATVSSVPVSGPTTGIARSVTPGQALRGVAYTPNIIATSGEPVILTEAQGVEKEKRAAGPTAANLGSGVKVLQSSQSTGKLGFHVSSVGSLHASGLPPSKKPPIARGVPPPVPPNKPIVPPKKEAAYLRRTDLSQSATQEAATTTATATTASSKLPGHGKQQTIASLTAIPCGTVPPSSFQQSATVPLACGQAAEEETKPR
ncbi:hypothetical protein KM043_014367 [Ampulex compressa]|nr:hypothetical protein KM043_014367 [Ampulex compressa]